MKRSILFILMALGVSEACSGAPASDLPFRLSHGYLILVECSVGNQSKLTAVIDTGATETILELHLVRLLSLQARPDSATSLTSDLPAVGVSIPDLRLGPLYAPHLDGIAMDLSHLDRELGIHPDLIIGMDLLHRANFLIDYAARVLRFGLSEHLRHSAPFAPNDRFVVIDSMVLGGSVRLKVDSGFNGLLLYAGQIVGSLQLSGKAALLTGVARLSGVQTIDSPEVRVGNWRGHRLSIAVADSAPRDLTIYDGLLGPRFLGANRFAFDFDGHMVYWD